MKALLCFSLLLVSLVHAQEARPLKHVRFIPLGELPPHGEYIEGGVRIHRPPPPGTVPPSPMVIAEDAKEGLPVKLRLKQFTEQFSLKPSAGGVKLFEGRALGGKPWLSSPFPVKSQTLGILYRDLNKMTWFEPKIKVVADDLASFPLGTVRFVNVSQHTAVVNIEGSKTSQAVKPGGVLIKKLNAGNNAMLIGYRVGKNQPVAIYRNNFTLKPKQRIQAFFYKAQGENPRKAVNLFYRAEFFDPPPKRKKAAAVAGG